MPTVVVYFSDHGESAFTARGHDSSRFVHEMARVPFLVFFNRAAATAFADRYRRMAWLARQSAPSTLAQLPATLAVLLAIDADLWGGQAANHDLPPIGAPGVDRPLPILVRNTPRGVSHVDLLQSPGREDASRSTRPRTGLPEGSPTRVYAAAQAAKGTDGFVCYHRSNTIATILRGLMVTDCLELDVVVSAAGRIEVVHPPRTPVAFELREALDIIGSRARFLWIDAKNIDDPARCHALVRELSTDLAPEVLVEFPPDSRAALDRLAACARDFARLGLRVAWYLPTERAIRCSRDLSSGVPSPNSCGSLRADLADVSDSRLFSDLSFDYRALRAVEDLDGSSDFRLNTWNVAPDRITEELLGKFGAVIVDTRDPNHY